MSNHNFAINIRWTGNVGTGTSDYKAYTRNHVIQMPDHPEILASSSPEFRGDKTRYNPEDLLVAALSSCHMLSYLHLCAVNQIVVEEYTDHATGVMIVEKGGSGHFTSVTLHPRVVISAASDEAKARELHHEAHRVCFIANSVNFPVENEPEIVKR